MGVTVLSLTLLGSPSQASVNPLEEIPNNKWTQTNGQDIHLVITGGEPLLNKNTLKSLDYLIQNPKDDLELSINSNLSVPEREHVTMGLYSHPEYYSLTSVTQVPNRSSLRWTVDVQADLDFARLVYAHLYDGNKYFGQTEILDLLQLHPEISRTDVEVARNSGSNK